MCAKCVEIATRVVRVAPVNPFRKRPSDAIPRRLCELHAWVAMGQARNAERLATAVRL